jgi:hypothetical protein
MLVRSLLMSWVPGTSNAKHLEQDTAGASLDLLNNERTNLDREGLAAS